MNKDSLILSRILSGKLIFSHKEYEFHLLYPSKELKYNADLYYQNIYDDYKFNDWIKQDDVIEILRSYNLWSEDGDLKLFNLNKQIDNNKKELFKSFFNKSKQKQIRNQLNNLKKSYQKYYNIRHSLDHLTVEGFCENLKNQFLLSHSLYIKENLELIPYKESIDHIYDLDSIAQEISKMQIDISTFRKLARSDIWRNYWSANKNYIFQQPSIDWTDEQRTLVIFSKMYDSARESTECPPDPVFDDDDMFDGWLLIQNEKHDKDKQQNSEEKTLGKKLSNAQEMFVMAKTGTDATEVHEMNSSLSKNIIRERSAALSKSKELDASKLPDIAREINVKSQEAFKNKFRRK